MQPFGHNAWAKIGDVVPPPFWGRPHLIQCRLSRDLPPYTKWHLNPSSRLAKTDMDRKLSGCCAPFGEGELDPNLMQYGRDRGLPA